MSDIRIYHLTRRTAEQALPELVSRAYGKGHKVVIRTSGDEETARLDDHLWTFHPDAFLPHGPADGSHAARQPVYLTSGVENPAGADVVMLMPGAAQEALEPYALCCLILNGHDEAQVGAARASWKAWKDGGHTLTYWQQTEQGKWDQKT